MTLAPPEQIELTDLARSIDAVFADGVHWAVVLWNDDSISFEWVISSLIYACGLTKEAAQVVALKAHTAGKAEAAIMPYDKAKIAVSKLTSARITATLEQI